MPFAAWLNNLEHERNTPAFRETVLGAIMAGQSYREVSAALNVSLGTISNWVKMNEAAVPGAENPVIGEFLKSRGDGCLKQSATVLLPPIGSEV